MIVRYECAFPDPSICFQSEPEVFYCETHSPKLAVMDIWGLLGPSPRGGIDRDIYSQHKAAIAPRQDGTMLDDIGTDDIKSWRSIITLIIFVLTSKYPGASIYTVYVLDGSWLQ